MRKNGFLTKTKTYIFCLLFISAELEVTIVNDAIYGSYTRLPDNEDTPTCTLTDPAGVQKCPMAGTAFLAQFQRFLLVRSFEGD